jgi:hypothetical protein
MVDPSLRWYVLPMAKPEMKATVVVAPVAVKPTPKPTPCDYPPARRVRVERHGSNNYSVHEDVYFGRPEKTRVLVANVARVPAEDEVRLWLENFLGVDRFGDSGL